NGHHRRRIWASWPLSEELTLKTRDRAGLGTLELHGPMGSLAEWRYTVTRSAAAQQLVRRFDIYRLGEDAEDDDLDEIEAPEAEEGVRATSTRALFRLWRFARPRIGFIILGFVLTVSSTAASLVPPYLTWPLLDDILIPYQSDVEE